MQNNPYGIDLVSALADVREFMTEISNLTGRWMPGKPGSFADVQLSRACMIFEEYRETKEAIAKGDEAGELDGLVDLLYVVLGLAIELDVDDLIRPTRDIGYSLECVMETTFCAMHDGWYAEDSTDALLVVMLRSGLPIGAAWNEVHAANMRKFSGGHYDAAGGKWKKPADWVGPDIAGVLEKYPRIKLRHVFGRVNRLLLPLQDRMAQPQPPRRRPRLMWHA